jgi:hypothetical protein
MGQGRRRDTSARDLAFHNVPYKKLVAVNTAHVRTIAPPTELRLSSREMGEAELFALRLIPRHSRWLHQNALASACSRKCVRCRRAIRDMG